MKLREIAKAWLLSRLGVDQINLPTDGRSSIEKVGLNYSLNNFTNRYTGVSPIISFEVLKTLKHLWLWHPEFSQHVTNFVSIANTGHQLSIDAANSQRAEIAINRLNETAARIYRHGAGVDGLINQELTSIAWSGADSTEDVVNLTARRVEKVVIVPVEDIRFLYEDNRWQAYQYVGIGRGNANDRGLILLHPETYQYYAVETVDNSPYAKPPPTAAVEAITTMQNEVIENVKYIVRKFSILGLLSVMVRRLTKRTGESDSEFDGRQTKFLKETKDTLSGSFNRGLVVAYDNMQFKGESVTANGTGFYEICRVISETVMSGLGQQPAFFGRTDSTTETYADVVYQLLLARAHNFQRLVKRRRERTYMLDLRLGGIDVQGVSLRFNKAFSRSLLAEAQAREIEIRNALEKARSGIISADDAAQELGYESAFDPTILEESASLAATLRSTRQADNPGVKTLLFRFDKESQKYRWIQETIDLTSLSETTEQSATNGNVFPIDQKKKALALN